ncbi:Uncharacterised protein [Mycobacteroides abscessus subsp. abscessus]|nr:Uncharacterised protein [Mycobacteroides abscessus subsp. abscessus]
MRSWCLKQGELTRFGSIFPISAIPCLETGCMAGIKIKSAAKPFIAGSSVFFIRSWRGSFASQPGCLMI